MMSTGTNGTRHHLTQYHYDKYLAACEKNGWTEYLTKLKSTNADPTATGPAIAHIPFSQKAFINYLLRFIIADDQVCSFSLGRFIPYADQCLQSINVIKCPEFRN